MRTVFWKDDTLRLIDQRRLPGKLEVVTIRSCDDTVQAIQNMTVRGAPAIGATAVYGLVLAVSRCDATTSEGLMDRLRIAASTLKAARPTAVNLAWAVNRVMKKTEAAFEDGKNCVELKGLVLVEAEAIADEDVAVNRQMGSIGAALIEDGDTILHHCNTGALAVVDWGTALGVIRTAHEQGKRLHVLVDETRPRLQGARLTAWELEQYGISYEIITDSMAGHFLSTGQVNKVFYGADRIAANGDVANKIGTYMVSLAAWDNGIPVYPVAPTSTIDLEIADGRQIPIEERDPIEVLNIQWAGERVAPENAKARNPAFDVTPNRLVTAIVTEKGIIRPPFTEALGKLLRRD